MGDAEPLEELMSLLRPEAVLAKVITGGGQWSVRKPRYGDPAFCLMLDGSCVLAAEGLDVVELCRGDFLLFPQTPAFTMSSHPDSTPIFAPLDHSRDTHHGCASEPVNMRMLGGYFRFDPASSALLVALLPPVVVARGGQSVAARLTRLVELIAEEADTDGLSRDIILKRLVEVLLIEAMRGAPELGSEGRGLIAGLADPVLAPALRELHADVARGWTVERLAGVAAVSRPVFAQRFTRTVGLTPMRYLLEWRVALAKELLRTERPAVAHVAQRVGYQSATAFTTAFARVTGCSPTEYARDMASQPATTAPRPHPISGCTRPDSADTLSCGLFRPTEPSESVELIGGVEKRVIEVVPPDPAWPAKFAVERETIVTALGGKAVRVDHIGSTSVPGLAAKPIIDIALSVLDVDSEANYLADLTAAGYQLRVREPGHRMLRTPDFGVHVHVCTSGGDWERRHLLFRDWLRYDESDRAAYNSFKIQLAQEDWTDMNAYADAKSPLITEITARAEKWATRSGWTV